MSTTPSGIRTAKRDSLDCFVPYSSLEQALEGAGRLQLDRGWIIAKKKFSAKRAYLLSATEFGELLAAGGQAVALYGAPATFPDEDGVYPRAEGHWQTIHQPKP